MESLDVSISVSFADFNVKNVFLGIFRDELGFYKDERGKIFFNLFVLFFCIGLR